MNLQSRRAAIAAFLLFFVLPVLTRAENVTPQEAVARASHNELTARDQHPFRYTLRKVDNGRITTKEIIETKDGDVARLIAIGDKPLPPDIDAREIQRLETLLANPAIQEHRRKREQADANRANEMIRLLPTAFVYQFEGIVDSPSGPCYRLSMKPNPNFNPPDRQAEVLHGMAGELWIDQKQERMVRLNVHLIADVEFGWGIFGKLFKGGTIYVEQQDVGMDHWEQNLMRLGLRGTILMFHSLTIDTTETESDFEPVPADWTYKEAVKALLAEKH
ncbi:MAG TPA: hypothetical protein VGT04_09390 [Acidobacteriaceae bacterium]|nr:hypothetical protein [Acidobacteriaceae bacterium]